jgi:hypothetical protein
MPGIKGLFIGERKDFKGIIGGKKRDITDLMYEAAEETAGIIKPIRLRSLYKERFKKDVDEAEIMKMANRLIKAQEKEGKTQIIKHEAADGGTIYLHKGAFDEWLSSTFLSDLKMIFGSVAMKTGGRRQEVEKYKLEDLLVEYHIPRGLSTEIVLDALCSGEYLIKNDDGTYSMPAAKEIRKKVVLENVIKDTLETKGFMPEDELVSLVMIKANEEFSRVERGSTLGGLNVNEGDVEIAIENMLGDRFIRLEDKVGDTKIKVIADAQNLHKLLEDAKPAVIENLRGTLKEKIGSDEGLTEEDVMKAIEERLKRS